MCGIADTKAYRNDEWNNSSIQYTSRRQSAMAHIKFDQMNLEDEDLTALDDANSVFNDDINVRVVEGRGDSSAENSIIENPDKDGISKLDDDSGTFDVSESDNADSRQEATCTTNNSAVANRLEIGSEFQFRITILDAIGISTKYADIFCQFNFLHRHEEAFSTEPLQNTGKGAPLGFYHVQNFCVKVTPRFIDYIRTQPIVFEIFGHFSHHPLHDESKDMETLLKTRPPTRMTLAPLSKPVPATNVPDLSMLPGTNVMHRTQCSYDFMVWFEICELEPQGEYTAVTVDHCGDISTNSGVFMLHQGIQRRIAVTIVYEHAPELLWRDVKEVVVGRIRNKLDADDCPPSTDNILSLSLLPGHYVYPPIDDRISYGRDTRTFYRFESSWDSSLHNSTLLNRVTPSGEKVYVTLTVYLELDNCSSPVVISKDLCLVVCNRDAKLRASRSLRSFFTGTYKSPDSNRVTGVYELALKYNDKGVGSPGSRRRRRRVIDTSVTYVRGEENLAGWRPRGDSLILEHQWQLDRFQKVLQVEKTRHILLLRDTLQTEQVTNKSGRSYEPVGIESKSLPDDVESIERDESGVTREHECLSPSTPVALTNLHGSEMRTEPPVPIHKSNTNDCLSRDVVSDFDAAAGVESLTRKCLELMKYKIPSIFDLQETSQLNASFENGIVDDYSILSPSNSRKQIVQSNSIIFPDDLGDDVSCGRLSIDRLDLKSSSSLESTPVASGASTPDVNDASFKMSRYIPNITEIRVSPVVSRRGYLNLLEPGSTCWMKRWVIVRRPYVFLYNHHKDPVERGMFNLGNTVVECSQEPDAHAANNYSFAVCTQHRGFVLQAANEADMHGWLYAFNPLLAGSISRSKMARKSQHVET